MRPDAGQEYHKSERPDMNYMATGSIWSIVRRLGTRGEGFMYPATGKVQSTEARMVSGHDDLAFEGVRT